MGITYEDLAARVGSEFAFATSAGSITLTLTDAMAHPDGHPGGSLTFAGPADHPLDQGTYEVEHADVAGPVFIVPIGEDAETRTYQAVFA